MSALALAAVRTLGSTPSPTWPRTKRFLLAEVSHRICVVDFPADRRPTLCAGRLDYHLHRDHLLLRHESSAETGSAPHQPVCRLGRPW